MEERFIGVYIMGDNRPTLYIGVTNNLLRRVLEHKKGKIKGFTQKYNLRKCLYYEFCENMYQAIIREKQLKKMSRIEKLSLIKSKNPIMADISQELFSFAESTDDITTYDEI